MSTLRAATLKTLDDLYSVDIKDIASLKTNLLFDQLKSGNFWIDVHPEAKIHRLNDRLFIGAAADNDGEITSEINSENKDWLEVLRHSTTNNTQVGVLSTIGQCAILGGSKTSDSGLTDSMGCIGVQAWAINDNIDEVQTAYGAYLEVRRSVGAGRTHGFELDVVNYGSAVSVQPYDMFQQGLTVGGWLASGGEIATTRASAALAIINNGSSWEKGIVFHSTSLDGTDGVTGNGVAVEMAKGHTLRWMFGSGSQGSSITSTVSNSSAEQSLQFSDIGMLYRNKNLKNVFQVSISDTYVNGLIVTPANSSLAPTIGSQGDDTDIDLGLSPKGAGLVRITNPQVTASAGAQQGYLQIKLGSTIVKIPYYAV